MFKSFASTFRKVLVATATAALAFTGIAPAHAVSTGSNPGAFESYVRVSPKLAGDTFTVPAAGYYLPNLQTVYVQFPAAFLSTLTDGDVLKMDLQFKNLTTSTIERMTSPSSVRFYYYNPNFATSSGQITWSSVTTNPQLQMDGYIGTNYSLPAGNYQIVPYLTLNDNPVTVETSTSTTNPYLSAPWEITYETTGVPASYTTGFGEWGAILGGTVCVDTTKIADGETINMHTYLNGSEVQPTMFETFDVYQRNPNWQQNSNQDGDGTYTISSTDLTKGLEIATNLRFNGMPNSRAITDNTTYVWDLSVTNAAGDEISMSCTPSTPTGLVAKASGSRGITSTFNVSPGVPNDYDTQYECKLYASNDLSTALETRSGWGSGAATADCGFYSSYDRGSSYVVTVRAKFGNRYSAWSAPSAPYTVPAVPAVSKPTLTADGTSLSAEFTTKDGFGEYKCYWYKNGGSTPEHQQTVWSGQTASSEQCGWWGSYGESWTVKIAVMENSTEASVSIASDSVTLVAPAAPTVAKPTLSMMQGSTQLTMSFTTPVNYWGSYTCRFYKNGDSTPIYSTTAWSAPCYMQNVTSSGTYTGTVSTSLNGGPETTSATSDGYVYTAPAVGYNPDITAGGSGVGKANRLSTSLTEFGTRGETSLSRIYTLDDKSWEIKLVSGANPTMVLRRLDAAGVVSGTANQTVALTSGFSWSIASLSLSGSTLGTVNVLLRKSPNMAAPSFVHYTMPVAGGTPTLVTEITAAQGTTFCNASGGSTTQTNTGLNSISLQTARTSDPLATLSCYGLINSQNVNTSALVKIAANGTITKLIQYADWAGANRGVLGTFSGGSMPAPPTTAHIGAGDAALTILVSTYDPSGSMSTANISTSKIYRISKTGVVTSTVATNLVGKSASDYSYTFVALSKSDETVGYRMAAPQNMMSAPEVFLATVSATAVTMASTKITANTDAALTMAGTMFSFTTTGIYTSGQKLNVVRQMSTPSSRIVAIAALDVAGNSLASGQAVTMTGSSSVPGVTFSSMYDASGNLFLFYSDSTNATKVSTMKWNSLTPPVAATPTVTTQVSGKATNTPAAGTKLTITGTNLGSVTSVKFGNVTATIGTRSATSLEVTVPNGATGTVTITLVHASGSVTAGTYAYVGATKVAQKVVLNAGAATAKIGDADRTLTSSVTMVGHTAVAAVVYTSTTTAVCTVTAGKLKFVAAGTCTVKATQPGSGWAAEGVATYSIAVRKAQTVTINALTAAEKLVSVEGVYLYANATSGLGLTYTFSTPTVCAKGTFVVNHVINLKAGTCTIVVSQAGDTTWAAASATITYTVGAAGTATIVDPGNVASPVTLPINGTKVNVLSEVVSWNKTTGALNLSSRGIWVGPITATATFKIGTTDYTCKVTYGTQKGVTDATAKQVKGFPAANLCSGTSATDKAALAALKKVTAPVTVKIVVVRDLRNPASYNTKGQTTTRSIYVIIK